MKNVFCDRAKAFKPENSFKIYKKGKNINYHHDKDRLFPSSQGQMRPEHFIAQTEPYKSLQRLFFKHNADPYFHVNYPRMTQTLSGYCLPLLALARDHITVSVFSLHLQMSLQD